MIQEKKEQAEMKRCARKISRNNPPKKSVPDNWDSSGSSCDDGTGRSKRRS